MTLDPVIFNCVMIRRMQNPALAMLTGKIKVKGLSRMPRMQRVFREPKLDDQLTGALFA
jgi:putative sterol carrier protein